MKIVTIIINCIALCCCLSLNMYGENLTRIIKDSEGKEIIIPQTVERITPIIGAFTQISVILGGENKLTSITTPMSPLFFRIFPHLAQLSTNTNQPPSVETLIASKTQVIFGPVSQFYSHSAITQLQNAKIAVVNISNYATINEMKESIRIIGDILGEKAPEKASQFIAYYEENIKKIEQNTHKLTQKTNVLTLIYSAGGYSTVNDSDIGSVYIEIAGGINSAKTYGKDVATLRKPISIEQIVVWNPDVIITYSRMGKEAILNNQSLKMVNAIKNNQVHVIPTGLYLWAVRSAEGALQPLWLATILYPTQFKTLSIKQEIHYFYNTFYHYPISDDEIELILNGNYS